MVKAGAPQRGGRKPRSKAKQPKVVVKQVMPIEWKLRVIALEQRLAAWEAVRQSILSHGSDDPTDE